MRAGSGGSVPDRASAPTPPVARPAGRPWADLRLRVLSALVLLPLGVGCVWAGGWAWDVLVVLGSAGLAWEYVGLSDAHGGYEARLALPGAAVVAASLAAAGFAVGALALLALLTGLVWLRSGRAALALGVPYIGLTAVALVWLRADAAAGRGNVLLLLLLVWATDIAAYLAGRLIGGPKLAPAISPGKTWSGAVGGLLGALLVGWPAAAALDGVPHLSILPVLAALSAVSQAGDLLESGIKRRYGAKDSGKLIPGHGGLLDRLDGVLTAAPLAALLALTAGPGVGFWR